MSTTQSVHLPSTSSEQQQGSGSSPNIAQNQATNANMVMFPLMMGTLWCQKCKGEQRMQENNFENWHDVQILMSHISFL